MVSDASPSTVERIGGKMPSAAPNFNFYRNPRFKYSRHDPQLRIVTEDSEESMSTVDLNAAISSRKDSTEDLLFTENETLNTLVPEPSKRSNEDILQVMNNG